MVHAATKSVGGLLSGSPSESNADIAGGGEVSGSDGTDAAGHAGVRRVAAAGGADGLAEVGDGLSGGTANASSQNGSVRTMRSVSSC